MKRVEMNEQSLLELWNQKRMQIITAQVAPAFVLIAIFVLSAQGTFANATDGARYLAIGVAAVTGLLTIISQTAVIREAEALVRDLGKIENGSAITKTIAGSGNLIKLMGIVVVGSGLLIFALVVMSVLA
jgi:hypothetical protein